MMLRAAKVKPETIVCCVGDEAEPTPDNIEALVAALTDIKTVKRISVPVVF